MCSENCTDKEVFPAADHTPGVLFHRWCLSVEICTVVTDNTVELFLSLTEETGGASLLSL